MKDIIQFIRESQTNTGIDLKQLYDIISTDYNWDELLSDDVLDTIADKTLYIADEGSNSFALSDSDRRKLFKGYEGVHFYGAWISEDGDGDSKISDAFFNSDYSEIIEMSDEFYLDELEEIPLYSYEDEENGILIICAGKDIEFIFLAEK